MSWVIIVVLTTLAGIYAFLKHKEQVAKKETETIIQKIDKAIDTEIKNKEEALAKEKVSYEKQKADYTKKYHPDDHGGT